MNYEKAYKEALERARDSFTYPDYPGFIRADVVFPELKESQDERISNQIINFIEEYGNPIHCEWQKDWISWLEKQGESIRIKKGKNELLNAIAKMRRDRAKKEDIITELADVSIMVQQLAFFYGWDEFKEERERKLKRLEDRINHHTKKGTEE